jgi:hypothetical protein
VALAGRSDPPLALARPRASAELLEILRLSTEEATALLNGSLRLGLAPEQVRMAAADGFDELSERELAVLRLLSSRLSLREIGNELYVSLPRQITRVSGPGRVMTDHPASMQSAHIPAPNEGRRIVRTSAQRRRRSRPSAASNH